MKLFVAIFSFFSCIYAEEIIVNVKNGAIRGRETISLRGTRFYAFQEIPYGKPPVGTLRFQEALPAENWEGILNTTENTKECLNYDSDLDRTYQTEDCLYLNVYTPANLTADNVDQSLAVLVYIHGGGFEHGNGSIRGKGPDFFMEEGIIQVTLNYRLGPFGFLTTEDGVIPANVGVKDQLLALKWVNENIGQFGGDKDKVTISGQSAGAASVGYLILSPRAKGLFRAGILQSGSPLCTWGYNRWAYQASYELANLINPNITNETSSQELLEYLQSLPAETIQDTILKYSGSQIGLPYTFSLIVEDPALNNALITEKMHQSLENGNFTSVPVLMGSVSEEAIHLADDLESFKKSISALDNNLSLAVNQDYNVAAENLTAAGAAFRSIYVNNTFQDDLGNAIRYSTDVRYTIGPLRHAVLHSKVNDVYFYQFSYTGLLGNATTYTLPGVAGNIGHGNDGRYYWKFVDDEDLSNYPESDILTLNRAVRLWCNFVKYLNPTPESDPLLNNIIWPKTSEENFLYIDIGTNLVLKSGFPRNYLNWKRVVDTYGNPPFDTY